VHLDKTGEITDLGRPEVQGAAHLLGEQAALPLCLESRAWGSPKPSLGDLLDHGACGADLVGGQVGSPLKSGLHLE
jgi:hypothetical protein